MEKHLICDDACTSFHCSNKETYSAVRTPEAKGQVTDSRIMGEWKWLFVNGCEFKGLIYVMMEFLNWFQERRDASVFIAVMVKNNGTSAE
jgi:hypothetical protein